MAKGMTDSKHYQNIAHAIRSAGSYEGPIAPEQMAERITQMAQAAYQAGGQEEYDRFWESAMESTDFTYRFSGGCWNDATFKPTKDINPTGNAYNLFYHNRIADLRGILEECGVKLDLSNCTGRVDNMFSYSSYLTAIPYLDLRNVTTTYANTFGNMFNSCVSLHTIECMHLRDDGSQKFTSTFAGCSALENLTIQGTIGQNDLNVSNCIALTHDSLMSVINALAEKSSETGYAVTLGWRNLAKLTDAEKAIATQKGWTLA